MNDCPYEVRLVGSRFYVYVVRNGVSRLLLGYATRAEAERDLANMRKAATR